MITYAKTDISWNMARDAHYATSFTPEKRADQEIEGLMAEMAEMVETFSPFATDENRAALTADLERYRQGYIKHLNAKLSADSRCMSSMITGPSNFPVRRNQKRLDTAHKRLEELLDYREKARDRLHKTYNPRWLANAPISADDPDAIEQLQAKIDKAEKQQELMKAVNKIVKSKKSDTAKIAELDKLEIGEETAKKILVERFAFQPYELTNNNANIRRMKERIEQLKKERSKAPAGDTVINGVTVSENTGLNRLQLFFPGKPSVEVRDRLKSRGFHWSPRECAWQRQLNDSARQAARQVLEGLK